MNLATLRLEGSDDALKAICATLALVVDSQWKKGDVKRKGGQHLTSGVTATLVDAANPRELVEGIRSLVAGWNERGVLLSGTDLSTELSVGVTVGDSPQFVAFIDFSAADLGIFGKLGLDLSIAAYPTSDEANEGCEARASDA